MRGVIDRAYSGKWVANSYVVERPRGYVAVRPQRRVSCEWAARALRFAGTGHFDEIWFSDSETANFLL